MMTRANWDLRKLPENVKA